MAISEVRHVSLSPLLIIVIFWCWQKKAFQVQYHCHICRMPSIHVAIDPFLHVKCQELVYFVSFISDRFDGNSLADMLEKSMTDWKKRQASQKEHVHVHVQSLQHLSQLSTRSIFCRLDPIAIHCSFNFPPTFASSLIAVFSFLVPFFCFFELLHGHSMV